MYKKGRERVVEQKCETTEVISKHELRLAANPFIIRSPQA